LQSTPSCFLAVALGVAELGHRVVGEHDQLHGRPLLAADGTPDACGAAAPTMNIAAALSCTAAAVRQVAGPDTASEGSWERSPGAVSDGPTMDLLALQRRCCCLSPGGPARRWRGSRRPRKTHLKVRAILVFALFFGPFRIFTSSISLTYHLDSSLHSRCDGQGCPRRGACPRRSDQRRWKPPGGHSLRAQLQRKRLRVPTPSLTSETKNKGTQKNRTPYYQITK
jgi:hypothetical protein